jgi:23S rRNA (adenine-N6)-dimethyltransferase
VGAPGRAPRASGHRPDGQHFLRSAVLASELVEQADVRPEDLVVEIGAGAGALTRPLAERARRVIAVERDPALAAHLRSRSGWGSNVHVEQANALRVHLPREPFRVFGNLPFSFGTQILRRLLDDVRSPLTRVDALVQFEMARKRTTIAPSTLVSLGWLPWWEFALVRRVPRSAFQPAPTVDAGMLVVNRREAALLPATVRPRFLGVLSRGFAASQRPLRSTFRELEPATWAGFAHERGIAPNARPADLDVFDWAALLELMPAGEGGRRDHPRRSSARARKT